MILAWVKENSWKLVFFLTGIIYIFLYAPYGFEGSDTGYIFGTSWNIYNGQFPHRDFIYTRPAIPAFLHTVFLFISETYGYLLERIFFYIQVFTYSNVGARLIFEKFQLKSQNNLYFIATIGALLSIHNYPPMGWNTIDGVFFCVLGIYFITKQEAKFTAVFFGSLLLVLGTFSKQSFYFVPIFIFLYLIVSKEYQKLKWYVAFGLFWVLAYAGFKYATDALFPFIDQTFVRTPTSGLVKSGIKAYYLAIKLNALYVIGIGALLWVSYKYLPKKYSYLAFNLIICGYMLLTFYNDTNNWIIVKNLFQLWLIGSGIYFLVKARKDNGYYLALLLLSVSWSASISNGYRTPIHFSLPFVVSLFFFFEMHTKQFHRFITPTVLSAYLITFFIGYQTIYRDSERSELDYALGEVFPQLGFIKSDKETYDELVELKELSVQYQNFTVLPANTQAHYLTKTINPIGIDWPLDVEINDEAHLLVKKLKEQKTTVFMEKKFLTETQLAGYKIKTLIEKDWKLIRETTHFKVYQN